MLIQNYGLFWERDKVDWGSRGKNNSGSLKGRNSRYLKLKEIDFRKQQGVYVLYGNTFRIIYIGQTGSGDQRLFVRLRSHKRDHLAHRWGRFSWFGILPVVNDSLNFEFTPTVPVVTDVLNHIEAILIAAAEPPLNLQGGRFGRRVGRYLQHFDNSNGADDENDVENY